MIVGGCLNRVLAIDIGNTSVGGGVVSGGGVANASRFSGSKSRDDREAWLREMLDGKPVDRVQGCSVVPAERAEWSEVLEHVSSAPVSWLHAGSRLGVDVLYPAPETLGADRLANVAGAHVREPGPAIIVDMGTAITFDVVSAEGFVGGLIAPGGPLMLRALHQNTAQLPAMDWRKTDRVIGRSTEEAMAIGADRGCRALVDGLVKELREALGGGDAVTVFATGGNAEMILRDSEETYRFEPHLTLIGLAAVAAREPGADSA